MKLPFFYLIPLCGTGIPALSAQGLPAPEIRPLMQYQFPTAESAAYLVEGSHDGQTWTTVAGPVFGDGGMARSILPDASFPQWRVRVVNTASYGPATTQLGGKTIILNDQGRARQLIFFPAVQGGVRRGVLKTDADHARGFVWKVRRTDGAAATVELTYWDGTSSTIGLNFSNSQLGVYQMRDRDPGGVVQVTEGGGFSLHPGRIRDDPHEAVLPAAIEGQSLLLEEGGAVTRLDVGTDGNVSLVRPDGSTVTRQYHYARKMPGQAELRLESHGVPGEIYQLQLTSQATGSFNRMPLPLPGNVLPPGTLPQAGTFNVPTGPVVANSTTGPPRSLNGKVLQLNGDDPVTLTFNSDGTGTATRAENGSVEVTPFTYDYSPTDEDEASLALTFPGALTDRVEDYDLEFRGHAGGSFRGSSFEGGERASSTTGTFNTNTGAS